MAALRSLLALCSLFIFVQSAVVVPRPSDCSTTTLNGVLVTGQVTHSLYFCTWYLEEYVLSMSTVSARSSITNVKAVSEQDHLYSGLALGR
jgi:hypothetical protein